MKIFIFVLAFFSLFADPKPSLLSFGVGAFDYRRDKYRTPLFRLEYKWGQEFYTVRPMVGGMFTMKKAVYVYGGFGLDWVFWNRLLFSPNFAAGFFTPGKGKDLHYPLEFRSGIELGYVFCNQSRVGVHFYHISNASLSRTRGKNNPGEETLVLFYAIPFN